MIDQIAAANSWLNGYVWGWPTIVLLLGTGLLLTVLTGGVQFRYLGFALREVLGRVLQKSTAPGSVSPFQAVATALASTVGVGNIAGVATAIAIGGPGALFWLWVSGVLGMCTKFAEIVIALHYREPDATGVMRGGAMYTLQKASALPWLGTDLRGAGRARRVRHRQHGPGQLGRRQPARDLRRVASLTGLVLAVHHRRRHPRRYPPHWRGHRDPGAGHGALLSGWRPRHPHPLCRRDPGGSGLVFEGAFTGTAATGGFAGSTMMMALRYGVARGLFSNEAGLGSAPMVHAAAQTDHPVRQGLYGIFEVFVDTILVCTTTGLVILVTGVWTQRRHRRRARGTGFLDRVCPAPGATSSSRQPRAVRLLDAHRLELLRRDRNRLFARARKAAVPYRLLWLVFIYLGAVGRSIWCGTSPIR